ncbi:NUDIX hydrolase domain-containingprotein [Purpureocillium lavendulum]|uniref:NUDIX hydrolase domain-containingprotein n=1 Tax=Purpureocillium lavendulum TaxID=1247861 RepID=A0AB34FWZ2_9HYPO|nr:NUDIX hydrolase domain-containingprotein [Purpureocillium lavendulum]
MSPNKHHQHTHHNHPHHHQHAAAAASTAAPPISAVHADKALFPASEFTAVFHASQNLMISCGCVPVDPRRRRVAILYDPHTGITQLPKGRKNIGEDVAAAALRETREETGLVDFRALLPLRVATRATPTAAMLDAHFGTATPTAAAAAAAEAAAGAAAAAAPAAQDVQQDAAAAPSSAQPAVVAADAADATNGDDQGEWHNLEDVTSWQPNTEPIAVTTMRCRSTLALKLVIWYVAAGDSTVEARADTREPWEEHYQLEWVDARDAPGRMTYAADASVVEKALDDMRRSGYDI